MISGFDKKLVSLIEGHPSILVGTCDLALVPCVGRGFGARVRKDRVSLDVLISSWPGPQTLANIEQTRRIAATFTEPETYESFQVKGQVTSWGECQPEDLALCEEFTQKIRAKITALNESPELVGAVFTARGLFRVSFDAESVYLQTPGKNAGERL